MGNVERLQRLRTELAVMESLAEASEILQFQAVHDPPDRYRVTFLGRGVERLSIVGGRPQWTDRHECEIRLPFLYPQQAPDLRWVTSLVHPNVGFSGLITLTDIGLPWTADIHLDVVCERLWDIARLAFIESKRAVNFTALRWLDGPHAVETPVDPRPLRAAPARDPNIVRYRRRGAGDYQWLPAEKAARDEVFYIGGEAADAPADTPPGEGKRKAPPTARPAAPKSGGEDGVFYIGDD